jgi:hypothetical protein
MHPTCVPSESRNLFRSSSKSFQNSPTANILSLSVSFRTCFTKRAIKSLSMCCGRDPVSAVVARVAGLTPRHLDGIEAEASRARAELVEYPGAPVAQIVRDLRVPVIDVCAHCAPRPMSTRRDAWKWARTY